MGGWLSSVVIEKSLINVISLLDNRRASAAASDSTTVHTSPEDPQTTTLDPRSTPPPRSFSWIKICLSCCLLLEAGELGKCGPHQKYHNTFTSMSCTNQLAPHLCLIIMDPKILSLS